MSANFHHRINVFLLFPSKQSYVPRFSQILIRDLLHLRCLCFLSLSSNKRDAVMDEIRRTAVTYLTDCILVPGSLLISFIMTHLTWVAFADFAYCYKRLRVNFTRHENGVTLMKIVAQDNNSQFFWFLEFCPKFTG